MKNNIHSDTSIKINLSNKNSKMEINSKNYSDAYSTETE
jgi:hypothetical protein